MGMNPSNPESQEALLRTLALRLTASPADPRTNNPQPFVGQLPADLPFEVPIPEGSRVIGSLATSATRLTIVLDVPLPPEQASAFYKERLQAAGWNEPEQPMGLPHSGFVHSRLQALSHSILFCKGPHSPSLHFLALAEQNGITDVRLDLNLDECESPAGSRPECAGSSARTGQTSSSLSRRWPRQQARSKWAEVAAAVPIAGILRRCWRPKPISPPSARITPASWSRPDGHARTRGRAAWRLAYLDVSG